MKAFFIIAAVAILAAGTYGGAHGLAGGNKIKFRHVLGGLGLTIGAVICVAVPFLVGVYISLIKLARGSG